MALNVAKQLIQSHLLDGAMTPGEEIALKIDQTLTQDATGTLVMLELEAMGIDRIKTELSAQYVDHNIIQEDYKNPEDHLFLQSACRRFGLWYSKPGNGVSHPVHMENFGKPGKTLLGSDSHTCAAGCLGMLAMGAGGIEVAMAMAGEPFYVKMPQIWGVELTGELADWVSAKDVILEMLRRHTVKGGVGRIIEYYGPGLKQLSAMDRHVIANMGAELGATATVFPSDEVTRHFLKRSGRGDDWRPLQPEDGADYDIHETIDLSTVEPLIAKPTSPDNVVPVRDLAGDDLFQAYIGSSANPGYRDFAICAHMVKGQQIPSDISFDINPSSRAVLEELAQEGMLVDLIHAGARLHQAGCNGCIGMGQAPAMGKNSLRTVPRNFHGRSGTEEDSVFLCSPETATASALTGKITDPRDLGMPYPAIDEPKQPVVNHDMLLAPLSPKQAKAVGLVKGKNVASIPQFDPLPDTLELPVLLKMKDNISTDDIMPAGAKVLPYRSNIPKISEFVYMYLDNTYVTRTKAVQDAPGHIIIGGENYGQGSSREHAALAPRYLGLRVVIALSFARIHWQNLANFGILALTFKNPDDYQTLQQDDVLRFTHLQALNSDQRQLTVHPPQGKAIELEHQLSPRQVDMVLQGGLINWVKQRQN